MERNSKVIDIKGTPFTVSEMPARTMLPIVQKMSANPGDSMVQLEMMSACLTVDGQPVDAGELGTSVYMQLMNEVMAINGLDQFGSGEDDEEKKP